MYMIFLSYPAKSKMYNIYSQVYSVAVFSSPK